MAEIVEIRNPDDLTGTYDQIEIQRGTTSSGSDMANIKTDLAIDSTTANDLSTGFTSYIDTGGTSASFYRFRYKISSSGATSAYSEIYQAGTTVMHTKFRNRMRDTNSANYFFSNDQVTEYLDLAIKSLYPGIYNEVIDESLTTSSTTRKYSFPNGIFRINDIEFLDSNGDVSIFPRDWKLRAKQIIFDSPPSDGYTFRLYADKMFKKLAEVPSVMDDLVLDLMALQAYQSFEADRSKYYRYTTVTNPEGGNMPSIARAIERLTQVTDKRLNALRRTRRSGVIKLV